MGSIGCSPKHCNTWEAVFPRVYRIFRSHVLSAVNIIWTVGRGLPFLCERKFHKIGLVRPYLDSYIKFVLPTNSYWKYRRSCIVPIISRKLYIITNYTRCIQKNDYHHNWGANPIVSPIHVCSAQIILVAALIEEFLHSVFYFCVRHKAPTF